MELVARELAVLCLLVITDDRGNQSLACGPIGLLQVSVDFCV